MSPPLYVILSVYDPCLHLPYLAVRITVHLQHSAQRKMHIARLFMAMLEYSPIPTTHLEAHDRIPIHTFYVSEVIFAVAA